MAEDRLDNEPVSQLEPVSQPTDQAVEEDLPIPPEVLENMPPEMRSAVIRASFVYNSVRRADSQPGVTAGDVLNTSPR